VDMVIEPVAQIKIATGQSLKIGKNLGAGFKTLTVNAPPPDPEKVVQQTEEFTRLVAKWMAAALLAKAGEHAAADRVWE